jgi:hypothetical protein
VNGVDDLTAEWLTAAVGIPVAGFTAEPIGTGQMSQSYRVQLVITGEQGPNSVVLKVAADDPTSRQTGVALGLYEREVRFYDEVAPKLGGPIAPCYHASFDAESGTFGLLLGDAGPAEVGNEIEGTTVERAHLAVVELARLHAPAIGDPSLAGAEWLNRDSPMSQALIAQLYAAFAERYADRIDDRHRMVCERLVAGFDDWGAISTSGAQGLVHGDYRLDNLLFGTEGAERPLTVVDWQTVTWGPAMTDLAYFLGCALPVEARRAHAEELMAAYHEALGPHVSLALDDVRQGVRRQSFTGVMMAIVSSMLVQRTERGDDMFMVMLERHCEHVLDTDALALLPEPVVPEPLQPGRDDEYAHRPGREPLWNESWYCDFVDSAQSIGGYVRLGLYPNEAVAWVTALLCGPDRPTIALLDFEAAVEPYEIRTERYEFTQTIAEPLQAYRIKLRGSGEAYDDPAALLAGVRGRPSSVAMDLEWATAGVPYQYRVTPRYEIPCLVTGTVDVDGETLHFEAVPGQRDHSWGVRDWWGMDWVWSAIHLDDGTHLHGVDIRIPGAPPLGMGYIQNGALTELQTVRAEATFADNGLPVTTALSLNPGSVEVVVDVQAHAPLRLVAGDGRVAQFPRSWVTARTSDGRNGVGWVEWNRNLGR